MADGDFVSTNPNIRHVMLLDAADATATGNGTWVDMAGYLANATIDISGIAGGTVITVNGSNAKTKPANSSHGNAYTTVSADSINNITPARWLKARVTTQGTGTVSVGVLAGMS